MSDRKEIEARASALEISFAPNIGDEKLLKKVTAAEADAKARAEADAKARAEADAKAKAEADAKARKLEEVTRKTAYPVIDRVRHNGRLYEIGDTIDLTVKEHLALNTAGAVPSVEAEE